MIERNGSEWHGKDWTGMIERNGIEWDGAEMGLDAVESNSMILNGIEWN